MIYFAVVLRVWRVLHTRVQELYGYTPMREGRQRGTVFIPLLLRTPVTGQKQELYACLQVTSYINL